MLYGSRTHIRLRSLDSPCLDSCQCAISLTLTRDYLRRSGFRGLAPIQTHTIVDGWRAQARRHSGSSVTVQGFT